MSSIDIVNDGETWTITAPADITVVDPAANNGVMKIIINYTDASLLNGQAHGIDAITFQPRIDGIANVNGFKTPVEFDITNAMSVPISGFDLMTFNDTPVGVPDTKDAHPTNFAHFHTIAPNAFAPETFTTLLPDFTPAGSTPASDIVVSGTLAPGATVTGMIGTLHSEEIAGDKNGFGIEFFPTASTPTSLPVISGLPVSEATIQSQPFNPFATISVSDTNTLPIETATIRVTDAAGALSNATGTLSGSGLTQTGVGTYALAATLPLELSQELARLSFTQAADHAHISLAVDNGIGKAASASTDLIFASPVAPPHFTVVDTTTNVTTTSAGEAYSGPVAGLQWQYINITTDSLNITSSVPNAFLRSGSGMDGLDVSQANGNNILDGSTGSNFLTGGTGNDSFYMDDRNPDSPIFSTIVNFHAGDNATVWGVNATDFKMLLLDNQGAAGFTGLDFVFTQPGHFATSFVLAGYTSADTTNGRLSWSYGTTPDLPGLPGSQYLTVHAN
jgi:hypothetical protein